MTDRLAVCFLATVAFAQTKIGLEDRVWVAPKIYSSIQTYFAHWHCARGMTSFSIAPSGC